MSQWDDYLASVNGQPIDVDGNWGPQCWDLWSHYAMTQFGASMWQTSTDSGGNVHVSGYACGIWHGFGGNLNWAFSPVGPDQPAQRGDVAIWEYGSAVGPLSHVALVVEDRGGALYCMTQNPGNAHYDTLSKDGLLGYLRPDNQSMFEGSASAPVAVSLDGDVATLAAAVLRGDFGNGPARQAALGARYDEVQAEVNRILSGGAPAEVPVLAPVVTDLSQISVSDLADAVMRGDYGNGPDRVAALGARYDEVQAEVNRRINGGEPAPQPLPAAPQPVVEPPVETTTDSTTNNSVKPENIEHKEDTMSTPSAKTPVTDAQIEKLIATADVWEPIEDPNAPVIPDNVAKPLWLILALVSSSTPYAFGLTVVDWAAWDANIATQAAALIVAWSGTLASVLGLSRFSKSSAK